MVLMHAPWRYCFVSKTIRSMQLASYSCCVPYRLIIIYDNTFSTILYTIHYTCTIPVGIAKIRFKLNARQSIWIFILFYFWLQIALIYTFFVVKLFFFLSTFVPRFQVSPNAFCWQPNVVLLHLRIPFHTVGVMDIICCIVLYCVGHVNIRFNSTAFYDSCLLHYIEELIFEMWIVNTHASKNCAQIHLKLCVLFILFFSFRNRVLFDTCYSKSFSCVGMPSI